MNGQQSFDFNSQKSASNAGVMSVSDLNQSIKSKLETGFSTVVLRGEISNFKAHSSGHFYFSLKDSESQISAVMFRGSTGRLKFRPKDGLEVLVRGKITVYKPRGSYQILCERMDQVGEGGLKEAFEKLKLKLKEEGLFASENKKKLPYLPFKIALVTSPTSAAVQDMLQILKRRHPAAEIVVVPTLTQGERAAQDIVRALGEAEKIPGVEAVLLSRGGGSLEDMWCFNDETLARKIFSMEVPVVSGVGHEIDFTIADFVADLRAPTPSAAAELVCKNVEEVKEKIHQGRGRLISKLSNLVGQKKSNLNHLSKRLVDPRRKLADIRMKVDELLMRSHKALNSKISLRQKYTDSLKLRLKFVTRSFGPKKQEIVFLNKRLVQSKNLKFEKERRGLERFNKLLEALSPYGVLDRGYSIVRDSKTNAILKNVDEVDLKTEVQIQFAKGKASANITSKIGDKSNVKNK